MKNGSKVDFEYVMLSNELLENNIETILFQIL